MQMNEARPVLLPMFTERPTLVETFGVSQKPRPLASHSKRFDPQSSILIHTLWNERVDPCPVDRGMLLFMRFWTKGYGTRKPSMNHTL